MRKPHPTRTRPLLGPVGASLRFTLNADNESGCHGGDDGTRTHDLLSAIQALFQAELRPHRFALGIVPQWHRARHRFPATGAAVAGGMSPLERWNFAAPEVQYASTWKVVTPSCQSSYRSCCWRACWFPVPDLLSRKRRLPVRKLRLPVRVPRTGSS